MLCTACSTVIKPVVAIDIDGTLGDYHAHLIRFAEAYMGMPIGSVAQHQRPYEGGEKFSAWFCREWGMDLTTFRQIKLAYRQGGQKRSMPPYTGCNVLVNSLRRAGVEVWLTTTRPYLRLDNIDPDTRFWLAKHGIEFDGILYDEDKYKVLAERIAPSRVVSVLDDLSEQCEWAAEVFGDEVPIVRATVYNREASRSYRYVTALPEALSVIQNDVRQWQDQHGKVGV